MICGGAVREKVMGTLTKLSDIDITNGEPSIKNLAREVELELSKKFSVKSRTMDDGHTSLFLGGLKLDFSSNFILPDIDNELSKMGVKKHSAIMREVYSRDFTCNSLLMNFELKKITDPTGRGINDIKNKIIRTCMSPDITLKYNLNRIIRVVYLASKLDFTIDPEIVEFIKNNKDLIGHIDPGYLSKTLNKAIGHSADRTAATLDTLDLWGSITIPETLYSHYQKRSKTAQLKQNLDYGEGFYANMPKYKSVADYRKKKKKKRKKIIQKIRDMKLASNPSNLYAELNKLRHQFAQAAQKVVDAWEQDEDGEDLELGSGGPCDLVAQALSSVVGQHIDAEITDGGQDGDDHAFIVVYNNHEAFGVDIPPSIYETGSGYKWLKKPGAKIDSADIDIWKIKRSDIEKQAYDNGIDNYLTDNFPILLNDDLQVNMDRMENDVEDEEEDGKDTGETLLEPASYSDSMYSSMHGDEGLFSFPLAEHPGRLGEDNDGVVNNDYNPIFQFNGLLESKSLEEMALAFSKLAIK